VGQFSIGDPDQFCIGGYNIRSIFSTHSYDKDGQKHYATEIIAQRVQFLGPRPNGGVTDIDHAMPADEEVPF
jgi:hypothetical protein